MRPGRNGAPWQNRWVSKETAPCFPRYNIIQCNTCADYLLFNYLCLHMKIEFTYENRIRNGIIQSGVREYKILVLERYNVIPFLNTQFGIFFVNTVISWNIPW